MAAKTIKNNSNNVLVIVKLTNIVKIAMQGFKLV